MPWPNCAAHVRIFLDQLEAAGWRYTGRTGEYVVVTCGCQTGHRVSVILWPSVPAVLHQTMRLAEQTTCWEKVT